MSDLRIVVDVETYPNCFLLAAEHADMPLKWLFEISDFRNDMVELIQFCDWIRQSDGTMIGFNNVGFDYPVLHELLRSGIADPARLYAKAIAIIQSQDDNRFQHMVFPSDRLVRQLDLFKVHHFDNRARSTSLKALEFNMRMDNISDLPFPVGTMLNRDQVEVLREYNQHDVHATKLFYHQSLDMIRFREELSLKHGKDFMNHSDVKIGKEIFQIELEKAGVQCYEYGAKGRQPRQTKRSSIALRECIPAGLNFHHAEFQRIHDWFAEQVITETKGAFKDVKATVDGLDYYFGTGGIHASVESEHFIADDEMMILDVDVTSLYPSIAIEYGHFPAHLGSAFVDVYRRLRTQRVSYAKGTAENAMLKLALNGVYGASGDAYSVFYDPLFTMKITIHGQLLIALLVDRLTQVTGLKVIQANTDGVTMYLPHDVLPTVQAICNEWSIATRLQLEHVEYSKMFIRDVNNYLCVYADGVKTKRKGAYEHDIEWHQNGSALVVPKVAEKCLAEGLPIRETVMNWPDKMDFMIRVKVPRTSKLFIEYGPDMTEQLENTCRYYVSTYGGSLYKLMPPLAKNPTKWRRIGVNTSWKVTPCNRMTDATEAIDYGYYVNEIEKLCLGVM